MLMHATQTMTAPYWVYAMWPRAYVTVTLVGTAKIAELTIFDDYGDVKHLGYVNHSAS